MSGRTAGTRRGAANSGVDKAWASGRVLTPEQRARKQEADRKANRFLKKEVQDRLAHLEARVLELESRDVDLASPLPGDDSFTTGTTAQQGDAGLTKSVPRTVDAGISLPTASVKLGPRGMSFLLVTMRFDADIGKEAKNMHKDLPRDRIISSLSGGNQ